MVLDINKKPARMLFTIENLAKSSREEKPSESEPTAVITFNDSAFTPVKLQTEITPLTSTPLSLPLVAPGNEDKSTRKRHNSIESEDSSLNSTDSKTRECSTPNSTTDESDCNSSTSESRKKARAAFTNTQVNELEKRYKRSKYLPIEERAGLAQRLKLSEQQIKTWFQNRRMKEKRQVKDGRTGYFPSGGVDVAQLAAYGIPCPPPHNVTTNQSSQLPGHVTQVYQSSPVTQQAYNTHFLPSYMYGYTQMSPIVYQGYTQQYHQGVSPLAVQNHRV